MVNHTLSEYREKRITECVDYEAIRDAVVSLVKVIYDESWRLLPDNDPEEVANRLWVFNSVLLATLNLTEDSFVTDGDEGGLDAVAELLAEKEED